MEWPGADRVPINAEFFGCALWRWLSMSTRISMAGVMTIVALFALTFAAVRPAGMVWAALLFLTIVIMLLISVLLMWASQGRERAFWTGFVLFGWAYLFLAYGPTGPKENPVQFLVNQLALRSQQRIAKVVTRPMTPREMTALAKGGPPRLQPPMTTVIIQPATEQLAAAFHAWMTIIFALAGAFVGRYIASRTRPSMQASRPVV